MLQAKAQPAATLGVKHAERREGGKEAARLKLEQTNRPSGPVFCKETPKESKKQNSAKAQVERT